MENTDETRRASLLWTANSSSFFLTYDSSRAPFHILEALGPEGADTGNVSHPLCLSDRPTFCHCPPACLGRCLGFCILLQPCNKHWSCTAGAGRRVSHLIHASRASAPRRRSESEGRREDGRPRGEGACPKVNPGNLLLTALLQSASGSQVKLTRQKHRAAPLLSVPCHLREGARLPVDQGGPWTTQRRRREASWQVRCTGQCCRVPGTGTG